MKASAVTQQVLLEGQPSLQALYDAHSRSGDLLDLRPQLALSKARTKASSVKPRT